MLRNDSKSTCVYRWIKYTHVYTHKYIHAHTHIWMIDWRYLTTYVELYCHCHTLILSNNMRLIFPIALFFFCRFEVQFQYFGIKLLIWLINLSLRFWSLRNLWVSLHSFSLKSTHYFSPYLTSLCFYITLSAVSSCWTAFSGFKEKVWKCCSCWSCQHGTLIFVVTNFLILASFFLKK